MKLFHSILCGLTLILSGSLYAVEQTSTGVTVGQPTNTMQTNTMTQPAEMNQTQTPNAVAPSDSDISFNVQKQLNADTTLSGSSISANTANGVVTLTGTARNQAQVDQATSIARSVNGVKTVQSSVNIQSSASSY